MIAETPDLLISTSHAVLRITLNHNLGAVIVTEDQGLYYGIRLVGDSIFLSARNATVSDQAAGQRELGQLLELTANGISRAQAPKLPMRDLHGIGVHGATLWATCSHDDAVAIYDLRGDAWIWWYPITLESGRGPDQHHFNTLYFERDLVWVLAHRRGPSELLAFPVTEAMRGETSKPVQVLAMGNQAHNIWRCSDGSLATCSSGEGMLISSSGWQLETGGFPRGVARLPSGWVVGISALRERSERDFSDAQLQIYDHNWHLLMEITLPKVGMILDIIAVPQGLQLPAIRKLPLAAS